MSTGDPTAYSSEVGEEALASKADRSDHQTPIAANKHGWTTIIVLACIAAWIAGFLTVAALYGTHGWLFPVVAFAPIVAPVFFAKGAGIA